MSAAPTLSALLSHWRAHPLQLVMLLLGLALATGLWTGVQAINAEARASYAAAEALLGQDRLSRLVPAQGARIDSADYVALRRAGWRVSPVLEGRLRLGAERVTLIGFDPFTAPPGPATGAVAGADPMRFLVPPGELLGAPETLARLAEPAAALGIGLRAADTVPPGTVLADIGIAQELLGAGGQLSRLLVWPDQPSGLPDWQVLAPGLRLEPPDAAGDLARLTESFHLNLTAFGFLSFAVGLFIVHAAVGLAFEQRRPVLRTLRTLGVPARRLMALMVLELVGLALLAGIAGVALGWMVAALLLPDVAATLGGLYGAAVPGTLHLRPEWWAAGLFIALAGTLVAAARGLWKVWRMPVLAPARPRAWARGSEAALKMQAAIAGGLGVLAAGLGVWGHALPVAPVVAGFALLAAVLLSAALALPVVLGVVLALAERRARGPVAQWFWADARLQLPGLSLALMALMLALAANIGVGTMVASFRLTFTGWLDQRLAAEIYLSARDETEAAELRAWLAADPRVDAVLPVWRVEARLAGAPGEIFGVADHATYRDHWPLIAAGGDVWSRVARGEAVLVNEQLARRAGLWPGQTLYLPGLGSREVAAVYSDYGNPAGQAMVGIDSFVAAWPEAPRLSHAIRTMPGQSAALAAALVDDFGLPPERVTEQAAAKALSLRIFERTFAVTGALNALTLGVAGLALLASLVTLSGMRLAQLAPLWALGLTRARLARLELLRTFALAGLTMAAALPVGLVLAWVLLAVINVEAFGWRLPMHVFPADWGRLGALALLAVGLAAAAPIARLACMRPARLLQVFAAER